MSYFEYDPSSMPEASMMASSMVFKYKHPDFNHRQEKQSSFETILPRDENFNQPARKGSPTVDDLTVVDVFHSLLRHGSRLVEPRGSCSRRFDDRLRASAESAAFKIMREEGQVSINGLCTAINLVIGSARRRYDSNIFDGQLNPYRGLDDALTAETDYMMSRARLEYAHISESAREIINRGITKFVHIQEFNTYLEEDYEVTQRTTKHTLTEYDSPTAAANAYIIRGLDHRPLIISHESNIWLPDQGEDGWRNYVDDVKASHVPSLSHSEDVLRFIPPMPGDEAD